jgi:CHAT domain-containing protein
VLEDVSSRVEREALAANQLIHPRIETLEAVRADLPADTAFLHYLVTDESILALVVTAAGSALHDLGASETLGADVNRWLELLSAPGDDVAERAELAVACRLYDRLVRPISGSLGPVKALVVSPDQSLAFAPFGALCEKHDRGLRRLIERWEVAYVPSATVHRILKRANRQEGAGFVGLGDPVSRRGGAGAKLATFAAAGLRDRGALERLPESGAEVRAIAELFPPRERTLLTGERATRAELERALSRVQGRFAALHLACHGHVDTRHPRLTGMFLAGGELLPLADVYLMRIPADLVVLSGCRTNKGAVKASEGVVGLVRGFFFAGCPRVVVSNWRVHDESTRVLMVDFYRNMLKFRMSPGPALRAAKLAMLRGESRWSSPTHWAPFVLWGLRH